MKNVLGVLKISSLSITLLSVDVLGEKPLLIYKKEIPLEGEINRGKIVDREGLIKKLSSLVYIEDEAAQIRINANEVFLLLPPLGFEVYSNDKTTNVIDENNVIENIDISNVISMVKKEIVPDGGHIVDIIPDNFILSDGTEFEEPPLGRTSPSLTIKAKVHSLSEAVYNDYVSCVEQAGFFVKRYIISSYGASALLKEQLPTVPSYFLLDMGYEVSYLSLVGNYSLYATNYFLKGEHDLINRVSVALNVSSENAEDLIRLFGLRRRKLLYRPKAITSTNDYGDDIDIFPDDVTHLCEDFIDDYLQDFISSFNLLTKGYDNNILSLPLVIVGSMSDLYDLDVKLKEKLSNFKRIYFFTPKVLGARKSALTDALGAAIIASSYKGSLGDQLSRVAKVERDTTKKGKEKR